MTYQPDALRREDGTGIYKSRHHSACAFFSSRIHTYICTVPLFRAAEANVYHFWLICLGGDSVLSCEQSTTNTNLGSVFGDLADARRSVLANIQVGVPEALEDVGEHLGLHHDLGQIHGVLRDLP